MYVDSGSNSMIFASRKITRRVIDGAKTESTWLECSDFSDLGPKEEVIPNVHNDVDVSMSTPARIRTMPRVKRVLKKGRLSPGERHGVRTSPAALCCRRAPPQLSADEGNANQTHTPRTRHRQLAGARVKLTDDGTRRSALCETVCYKRLSCLTLLVERFER